MSYCTGWHFQWYCSVGIFYLSQTYIANILKYIAIITGWAKHSLRKMYKKMSHSRQQMWCGVCASSWFIFFLGHHLFSFISCLPSSKWVMHDVSNFHSPHPLSWLLYYNNNNDNNNNWFIWKTWYKPKKIIIHIYHYPQ